MIEIFHKLLDAQLENSTVVQSVLAYVSNSAHTPLQKVYYVQFITSNLIIKNFITAIEIKLKLEQLAQSSNNDDLDSEIN